MRNILLLIILGLALSFTLQQEVFNATTFAAIIDAQRVSSGKTPSIKTVGTTNVLQLMSNLAQYQLGQLQQRSINASLCSINTFNNNLNQNMNTYALLGISNFQGSWDHGQLSFPGKNFTTHQTLFSLLRARPYFQKMSNQAILQFGFGIAHVPAGRCGQIESGFIVHWVFLTAATPITCVNAACTFPTQASVTSTIPTPFTINNTPTNTTTTINTTTSTNTTNTTTPTNTTNTTSPTNTTTTATNTTNTTIASFSPDSYSVPAASASNGGQPFLPTTRTFQNGTVYTLASNEMWVNQTRCNPALPNTGYPADHLPSHYIAAVNKARSNPLYYRNLLEYYHYAGELTAGGIDYFQVAYNFLTDAQKNVTANSSFFPNYTIHKALNSAAQYMAEIQSKQNHAGCVEMHRGPGNTFIKNRLDGYINTHTIAGENIAWTPPSKWDIIPSESVVLQWIVDFQVPTFGHRENIFSTRFTHYGHGATYLTSQSSKFNCVSISGNTITRTLDNTFTTPSNFNVQVFGRNPVCHKPDCSCDETKTTTKCVYCQNL